MLIRPVSQLFYGIHPENYDLLSYCAQHCECYDVPEHSAIASNQNVGGDVEMIVNNVDDEASLNEDNNIDDEASSNEDDNDEPIPQAADSEGGVGINGFLHFSEYLTQCNPIFGRPREVDCKAALDDFIYTTPNPGDRYEVFQFAGVENTQQNIYPKISVPKNYRSGTCILRIQPPEDPEYSEDLERFQVSDPSEKIIQNCVRYNGIGGQAHITYENSDYSEIYEVADRERTIPIARLLY